MQRISREFINFRYENISKEENEEKENLKNQKINDNDYFELAGIFWFLIIPPAMLLIFVSI